MDRIIESELYEACEEVHPTHYKIDGIEAIDVIEGLGWGEAFCLGNAVKYITRAGKKGDKKKDLMKAMWYIQRCIDRM